MKIFVSKKKIAKYKCIKSTAIVDENLKKTGGFFTPDSLINRDKSPIYVQINLCDNINQVYYYYDNDLKHHFVLVEDFITNFILIDNKDEN